MNEAAHIVNDRERACPRCSREGVEETALEHPRRRWLCANCGTRWATPLMDYLGEDATTDGREELTT